MDTPLPNLNIVVNDGDVSGNAEYNLELESVLNSEGVFSVYPTRAIGRTPVIIRVVNPDALDYELESGRSFVFKVNAVAAEDRQVLSSCEIRVIVTDANDNVPIFEKVRVQLVKATQETLDFDNISVCRTVMSSW